MSFFTKYRIQIFIFTGILFAVNALNKFFMYEKLDAGVKFAVLIYSTMSIIQLGSAGKAIWVTRTEKK